MKNVPDLRAFTMVEMLVSLAIASIITAVGTTAVVSLYRQTVEMRRSIALHEEGKILMEAILPELQAAGGDSVRPHMAISVQQGAAGASDVLTIQQLAETSQSCPIQSKSGVNLIAEVAGQPCCLAPLVGTGDYITLVSTSGNLWVTLLPAAINVSACKLQASAANIVAPQSQLLPPTATAATSPSDINGIDAVEFENAKLSVMYSTKIYRTADDQLVREDALDDTGHGFVRILADRVYDFQVALGYDVPDADGVIQDFNNTNDEVLGNATGDALGSDGLLNATDADLRTVKVGIVHGVPLQAKAPNRVRVLDGALVFRDKTLLRATTGTASFRNLFIFQ